MGLKFVKRQEIKDSKWNEIVAGNPQVSHSNFTWFLDEICKNWGAFTNEDQSIFFPCPYLKGVGNLTLYQPIFSRELSIIAPKDISVDEFIDQLKKEIPNKFKFYHFNSSYSLGDKSEKRVYQIIENAATLEELKNGFSDNAKRQIRKYEKEKREALIDSNITEAVGLIKKILSPKVSELKSEEFKILMNLVKRSMKEGLGHMVSFCNNPEIRCTGFFMIKNETLIFIKGAAEEDDMKSGGMYALMNEAFKTFESDFNRVDFDGSNIEGVASFYKKFGAKDKEYFQNKNIDQMPFMSKLINKLF